MTKGYLKIVLLLSSFLFSVGGFSQSVSISSTGAAPDTTAMLDVSSSTKGLLVPRMTAVQKNAIANPATGLLVYQTDGDEGFYYYSGAGWLLLVTTVATDRQRTLLYTTKGF
ncbi:MAG: hypothetical protein JST02_15080 [Bacteroidetes bacterium]|nr:hypothetical protein [Bacteroidota bacterium]